MIVIKRNGVDEPVSFDKIKARISAIKNNEPVLSHVDEDLIAQKVIATLRSGISTSKLDDETVNISDPMSIEHYEYGDLASRIAVSNYHKNNLHDISEISGVEVPEAEKDLFLHVVKSLSRNMNMNGDPSPRVNPEFLEFVTAHHRELEAMIDYSRDYQYDTAGFSLLKSKYLLRTSYFSGGEFKTVVVERPQHMIMRVAVAMHMKSVNDFAQTKSLTKIKESYDLMSQLYFTHATPTLFNAGTPRQQLSSCFLTMPPEDSINGIYDWYKNCANISKWAGGIGSHVHNLRSRGSYIQGTDGFSNGLVPWLRTLSESSAAVDQGGNKRPGSHAVYLEPWHADFMEFISLKKQRGSDSERAKKLFYGLWICDEFMKAVENGEEWYFMCPNVSKGLSDVYGEEFSQLYREYVAEGRYVKSMPAQKVWTEILESVIETGGPYMLCKDSCNRKSNQKNLGVIKSSNLCTEIIEYSSPEETAVCNLASICLNKFCRGGRFDFEKLGEIVRVCVRNLNRVIDIEFYPIEEARRSNERHRPIGIGVQGLADTFAILGMSFDSAEAEKLDAEIFETIYYHAVDESRILAERDGAYESYEGSPVSRGELQFDMWDEVKHSNRLDWESLKKKITAGKGLRNSLLVAPMPTASTSTVMGNSPCFEPYNALYYKRRQEGEHIRINRLLLEELCRRGLWNEEVRNGLRNSRTGGIADIGVIPEDIKSRFKTAWDMSPKVVLEHAVARGPFVDQSQSLNLFVKNASVRVLTQIYFYAWRKGLKTMSYYVRGMSAVDAQKVTAVVDQEKKKDGDVCRMEDDCVVCSS